MTRTYWLYMFGTSGVRGPVGDTVDGALGVSIGRAVGVNTERVVLGRDPRDSGRALADAVAAGLQESGTDVLEAGVESTPTIARAIRPWDADAGIIVTASHNPPQDNGFKLWTPSGQAYPPDRQAEIADRIRREDYDLAPANDHGIRRQLSDPAEPHYQALVATGRETANRTDGDLATLSVIVDIGNGAGGITADVLYDLGCEVTTLNAQPDGRFPGRPSEPTADNCQALQRTVTQLDADLGIAHDGDADRMMAVADDGTFLQGDQLLAVFTQAFAAAGSHVAVPIDTSMIVDDAARSVGASVVHTPVGDVHVAERARADDVTFGGEPSGAWIFPDETLCPDGPLAAVKLATLAAARPLSDRLTDIDAQPIRRTTIETERKSAVMDRVAELTQSMEGERSTLDGVRLDRDDGWMLIRASGTQPLIRITAEARDADTADRLLAEATSVVRDALDSLTQ